MGITMYMKAQRDRRCNKKLEQGGGKVLPCMVWRAQVGAPEGYDNKSTPAGTSRSGASLAVIWSKRGHGTAAREAYAVEWAQQ